MANFNLVTRARACRTGEWFRLEVPIAGARSWGVLPPLGFLTLK
ncbi:MAG: hypothetical protein WC391_08800 [Methanoregula sp.]